MTLEEIKNIIKENLAHLKKEYYVSEVGVFGSYATGEQKEDSDIDVLIEIGQPIGLFKFVGLKLYLEEKLNKKVDLVTKRALKPLIKDQILDETVYIYG